MIVYKFLLAVALLTGRDDILTQYRPEELFAALAPTVRQLALHLEILDERETHLLHTPTDWGSDVRVLRQRYHECRTWPGILEIQRFPERDQFMDWCAANRAYRKELEDRLALALVHEAELRAALQEVDHLYRIYDGLRDARCEHYYLTVRRQALQQVRELLGDEAFFSGALPPHVPVWRLENR